MLRIDRRPKVLESRILARSWRIEYFEDTLCYGDADPEKYTWYRSPDFAIVVALGEDGRIPLVRQYRHAAKREFWELPAGLVEEAESPLDCARREFEEEVGRRLIKPRHLATFYTVPSRSNQRAYLFEGEVGGEADSKPDCSERITCRFVELSRVGALLSKRMEAFPYLAFLIWQTKHQRSPV